MMKGIMFNIWLMEFNTYFQSQGYDLDEFPDYYFKDDFDLGCTPEMTYKNENTASELVLKCLTFGQFNVNAKH
jgi:hypothetical protein